MNYASAAEDFRQARRQASLEQIVARLTGKSADLLSYGEVRDKLQAKAGSSVGLRDIPLDAIVGSVGRYADFTRSFLPKQDSAQDRWSRIKVAINELEGLPPIEVYQIGEVYFVRDGNHRVSVARQLGVPTIQAYVTEIESRVPLTTEIQPENLILKAEYADFLERTNLDQIRPGADLEVTVPGQYQKLLEHIEVHRYFMGIEQQREVPYEEAVAHWYDEVYTPVAQTIRQRSILRDFPERTEPDLYLWIAEHRAALTEALGWEIQTESAATDLATYHSPKPQRVAARVGRKIRDAVTPDELEEGPPPGSWREERLSIRRDDRLFADILVPLSGEEVGWYALDQALEVARREGARLHGLHVLPSEEQAEGEEARTMQAVFERRCAAAGVAGNLVLDVGKVSRTIANRARWTDLVIVNLAHPPGDKPVARLSSGFRTLLLRCPRPVLAVPRTYSPLHRALLAYDGSPKAEEALFVAAYLAGKWGLALVVLSVLESGQDTSEAMSRAREYLEEHDLEATLVQKDVPVADAILATAEAQGCDSILMGGYGHSPVIEAVLGSAVDQVLRESRWPVLICR